MLRTFLLCRLRFFWWESRLCRSPLALGFFIRKHGAIQTMTSQKPPAKYPVTEGMQ
jgi:hypothetical protein